MLSRAITQIEAEVSREREADEEPSQEAAARSAAPCAPPAAPRAGRPQPPRPGRKDAVLSGSGSRLRRPVPTSQSGLPGAVSPLHTGPGRKKNSQPPSITKLFKNLKMTETLESSLCKIIPV